MWPRPDKPLGCSCAGGVRWLKVCWGGCSAARRRRPRRRPAKAGSAPRRSPPPSRRIRPGTIPAVAAPRPTSWRPVHLLKAQTAELEDERALRLRHLRNQSREGKLRRVGQRIRMGMQVVHRAFVAGLIGLGLLVMLYDAFTSRSVVVDAFESPPAAGRARLTGEVVASGVLDALQKLQTATRTSDQALNSQAPGRSDIKVEVPETGVSIGEIDRLLARSASATTCTSTAIWSRPTPAARPDRPRRRHSRQDLPRRRGRSGQADHRGRRIYLRPLAAGANTRSTCSKPIGWPMRSPSFAKRIRAQPREGAGRSRDVSGGRLCGSERTGAGCRAISAGHGLAPRRSGFWWKAWTDMLPERPFTAARRRLGGKARPS